MDNKHSQSIPAENLAQIKTKIKEIEALIAPVHVPLTPEERHEMLKMGAKSLSFVEKAHAFATEHPELLPPLVNLQDYDIDYADAVGLWSVRNDLEHLYTVINDIVMTSGSEAYQASLVFYNYLKVAADNKVANASTLFAELKQRFPGNRRRTPQVEPAATTVTP